jgi:adenine-specific DNA methylase
MFVKRKFKKLAKQIIENDLRLRHYRDRWIFIMNDKSKKAEEERTLLRQGILLREKKRRDLIGQYNLIT